MTGIMRISPLFLVFLLALAVTHNTNAKKPDPEHTTIASAIMALCSPYQEGKKKHDMKCTRKLTDDLKKRSEETKKFIESADNKAICTGNEQESSLLRFDSACSVIAHLCDYMQLGQLKRCPEAQPIMRKEPVRKNAKKAVAKNPK